MTSEFPQQGPGQGGELIPPREGEPAANGLPNVRVWDSSELFGNQIEVLIQHGEQVYRLRRTRNGKLILCK